MIDPDARKPGDRPAPPAPPARVKVTDDRGFERTVLLQGALLRAGRDPGNDLRLEHPSVAPCHFLILREGDRFLLTDAGGGAETLLNGRRALRAELHHGDVLTLGPGCPYQVTFLVESTRASDRERQKLRTLLAASRSINSSLVLDDVLERVMDAVMEVTQAEKGFLMLAEQGRGLRARVARNIDKAALDQNVIPASRSVIQEVMDSGRSIFLAGEAPSGVLKASASMGRLHLQTIMCVPLASRDEVLGVIYVDHRNAVAGLTKSDLEILESLADHAVVAIENARLTERMLQAERVSGVGRMVSSILHDLRGPIAAIRAAAQLIEVDPMGPKTARLSRILGREAERLTDMTQEILDFCRGRTSLSPAPCEIGGFLEQAVARVREEMETRSIRVALDVRERARVRVDARRMERVLRNLFDNAAEAMPEGGVLTVGCTTEAERVVVCVTDTGRGMTEEVRRRIFEPFFTEGKRDGTGLGMAIAKRIVEAHGGEIEVASSPGVGTLVRLLLPAAARRAAEPELVPAGAAVH